MRSRQKWGDGGAEGFDKVIMWRSLLQRRLMKAIRSPFHLPEPTVDWYSSGLHQNFWCRWWCGFDDEKITDTKEINVAFVCVSLVGPSTERVIAYASQSGPYPVLHSGHRRREIVT